MKAFMVLFTCTRLFDLILYLCLVSCSVLQNGFDQGKKMNKSHTNFLSSPRADFPVLIFNCSMKYDREK